MNLPPEPGLARRLAYGTIVRNRMNRFVNDFNTRFISVETHYFPICKPKGIFLQSLIENTTVEINIEPIICPICQTINEIPSVWRKLSCTHTFHIGCIEYWLKDNTTCPMCRHNLDNN